MKTAYIECGSGVSGDMLIGAMLDLGLPLSALEEGLAGLGINEFRIGAEKVVRGGLTATKFNVEVSEHAHARSWKQIRQLIEDCGIDADVKEKTLAAFSRLAAVESAIHGIHEHEVHFHELSGIDTIVDIAGAFIGMKRLGVEKVIASPVNVGSGTVKCAHGELPVPAPATAELLKGKPIYSNGKGELATPTGALLLTTLASEFGPLPPMKLEGIGCGAGGRETTRPNMLRIFLGETARAGLTLEPIIQVQANIDDMNPQVYPYLIERLLAAGARDAYIEPVTMKKGRPASVFNAFCGQETLEAVIAIIIEETTTLGVRILRAERACIDRAIATVDTVFGPVNIKIGIMDGKVANVMPEYEDCAAAARRAGAPLLAVMDAARAAAFSKWKPGSDYNV